jgi:galactose-1-phosphate uridylyltransferase
MEDNPNVFFQDHAEKLTDLPDEYLRDIGPVIKKIAQATGAEQYNVVQVYFFNIFDIGDTQMSKQNNGKLAFQVVPPGLLSFDHLSSAHSSISRTSISTSFQSRMRLRVWS